MQLCALAILTLGLCRHIILNHRLICECHEYSCLRKPFSHCFAGYLDWGKQCELTLNVSLICGHFTVSGEKKYFQYSKTIFWFSEEKNIIVGFIASLFVLLININKNICQQCSLISWNHSLSTDPRVWQGKKKPKHSPKVDQLYGFITQSTKFFETITYVLHIPYVSVRWMHLSMPTVVPCISGWAFIRIRIS